MTWAGKFFEWACPGCGDARCATNAPNADELLCRICELKKERDAARADLDAALRKVDEIQLRVERLTSDLANAEWAIEMWRDSYRREKGTAA